MEQQGLTDKTPTCKPKKIYKKFYKKRINNENL